MKSISQTYKRKLDKKIDALMDCIAPMARKFTRKELLQIAAVGLFMMVVGIYLYVDYTNIDESNRIVKFLYGGELLTFIWLELYYVVMCLYNQFQTNALRNVYVALGYVAIVFGGFFSACLTVVEMIAHKANVYHIYKHYYMVFMALPWTMIFTMIGWEALCSLEKRYAEYFAHLDWWFLIWIFLYLIIKFGFWICLKVGCYFFKEKDEVVKYILNEMGILFYISVLICMLGIWGVGILEKSENTQLLQGFLNATTVWLLYGTIQDKIGSGKENNFF